MSDIGVGSRRALQAFNESYAPEPTSGCWLWTGTTNEKGYGVIQRKDYRGYAHRFSFLHYHGPIPDGHEVCHKCDTPPCVNPAHLYAGTRQDNMRDCLDRQRHPSQNGFDYLKGEDHPLATITDKQAEAILALRGKMKRAEIAARFGVTAAVVKGVMSRKVWKHVRDPNAGAPVDSYAHLRNSEVRTCEVCGTTFTAWKSQKKITCSRACGAVYQRRRRLAEPTNERVTA